MQLPTSDIHKKNLYIRTMRIKRSRKKTVQRSCWAQTNMYYRGFTQIYMDRKQKHLRGQKGLT